MTDGCKRIAMALLALGSLVQLSMAQRLDVVATLPSLASITESIGGRHVKVFSITRGVQDAHYIEAKPSYMVKLHRADLLIYSGLELEMGWLPLLIQGARNNDVAPGARGNLNASAALGSDAILERPKGEVDRSMGDIHPAGNPHYLLDPRNGIKVAEAIADKLIELDPDREAQYLANLEQFASELGDMTTELEVLAAPLRDKEVVCYHVHWSYFLNWLGIRTAGYVELRPGIPPSPRHKRDIIDLMDRQGIDVVVVSSWKDPKRAQEVADAAGATMVVLPGEVDAMPGTGDYVTWMRYMVNSLNEAFNGNTATEPGRGQHRNRARRHGS